MLVLTDFFDYDSLLYRILNAAVTDVLDIALKTNFVPHKNIEMEL